MSEATCAILAAIFPLILVTGVLERRNAHMRIRRHAFYRRVSLATFTVALSGTVYAVVGVELHGFAAPGGVAMWVVFGIAILGLAITLIASMATAELEEERPEKGKKKRLASS